MSARLRRPLRPLRIPNYRRYFVGQLVSLVGTWMESIAETWLVLTLTHSGVAVGAAAGLQMLPVLLGGAWGGVIVDRFARRRLLMATQGVTALLVLTLFALVVTGAVELWMIYALLFARGVVSAVDIPARHAFVAELVGPEQLLNAVGLTSAIVNATRTIGPALAGVTIATVGVAPCFAIDACSFLAMIVALHRIDPAALTPSPRSARAAGQIRSGLRYVRATPQLWITLALIAVCATFTANFPVLLPLLATFDFHGGAGAYAALASAMGAGGVIGALTNGMRAHIRPAMLLTATTAFGALTVLVAFAPSVVLAAIVLVPLGAAWVAFAAGSLSALQLTVAPEMRGRVLALFAIVTFGSAPIGAPLMGWVASVAGPRAALAIGGSIALATALAARVAFARSGVPARVPLSATEAPA